MTVIAVSGQSRWFPILLNSADTLRVILKVNKNTNHIKTSEG